MSLHSESRLNSELLMNVPAEKFPKIKKLYKLTYFANSYISD